MQLGEIIANEMVCMIYASKQLITLLMKLKKCWTVKGKDKERAQMIQGGGGDWLNHFSYTNEIEGENKFT